MVCSVCNLADDGYHFKALSCRACAAFFRRSVVRKAQYTCKFGNDCSMTKELRKTCAACRLVRCKQVGMCESDVQWHRDANGPLKIPRQTDGIRSTKRKSMPIEIQQAPISHPSSSSSFSSNCSVASGPTTSSCSSPLDQQQQMTYSMSFNDQKMPLLNQLQATIQEYFKNERALYTMLYPNRCEGDTIVFHPVTHTELVKMEKGCLSLLQQMMFQINPSLELLSSELKLILLRSFFNMFSPLRKVYLTSLVFPDPSDNRIAFHFGQYINIGDMNMFLKDNKDPKTSFELSKGISTKVMPTVQKTRYLKMRELEFSALAGLILANEVDMLFHNESMAGFRNQIYQELHDDILINYPQFQAPNRFGSLICLLQDFDNISKEIEESVSMCKLFSPHKVELWD